MHMLVCLITFNIWQQTSNGYLTQHFPRQIYFIFFLLFLIYYFLFLSFPQNSTFYIFPHPQLLLVDEYLSHHSEPPCPSTLKATNPFALISTHPTVHLSPLLRQNLFTWIMIFSLSHTSHSQTIHYLLKSSSLSVESIYPSSFKIIYFQEQPQLCFQEI